LKNEAAEKGDFVEIEYQNKDINEGKEVSDQFILGEGGFVKGFEDQIIGMRAGEEKMIEVELPARHNLRSNLGGEKREPAQSPLGNQAGKNFKVKVKLVQKIELPEINDEFAKQLGTFENLATLEGGIKEGIIVEKTESEKQRKRGEILEKISEKTKIELPDSMIEYEKQRLLDDLKNKVTQGMKISFEEYLATVKKTEQEIKDTFQKEAEKRLKGFLILREIGKEENVEVSDQEAEEEANKSIKNFSKDQLAEFDINKLKEYTKGVIINEKIFQILESFSN